MPPASCGAYLSKFEYLRAWTILLLTASFSLTAASPPLQYMPSGRPSRTQSLAPPACLAGAEEEWNIALETSAYERAPGRPINLSYQFQLPKTGDSRLTVGWCSLSNTRPLYGGQVAQLVEHSTENRSVAGSIPALATTHPSIDLH